MKNILALLLILFSFSGYAFEVPPFTPNVVDQSGKLSSGDIARINSSINDAQKNGVLVGVFMTSTIQGYPIENVADEVFKVWKLGQKGKDNGVLIVVAVDDRKMRIEVGYGLEGRITDAQSQEIIQQAMKPNFKKGEYAQGIVEAVNGMSLMAKGEYASYEKKEKGVFDEWLERTIIWSILFLLVPAIIMGFAVIIASAKGDKGYKLRRANGQNFFWYFLGLASPGDIFLKGFLYVNPGIFITLFPVVMKDQKVIPLIMNFLGVACVGGSIHFAIKRARQLFSEAEALKWVEAKKNREANMKKFAKAWMRGKTTSSSSSSYDSGWSSSSSSDSSWSSSDSSSDSSSSSSSDGGDSGGGGSSGDW